MFPMLDKTGSETAKWCVPYMAGLVAVPFAASAIGATSWMFAFTGFVPNFMWIKLGLVPFYRTPDKETARNFFLHSLWYLVAMYGAFVLHAQNDNGGFIARIKKRLTEYCPHVLVARD